MCPARCPSGRQCAPDAPTDANGCFDMDCMCETPKALPQPSVPADQSCHKLTPVDASGCFVPPCTCIRNSCTNPCPPDQICELKTPLDDNGCPMSGCTCGSETFKSGPRHHWIAMLVRWKEAALVARDPEPASQQAMGRSTRSGSPLAGKKTEQKSYYEQKWESEQKPQREPTPTPQQDIGGGNTWRETERATQNHLVGHSHGKTKADSAQEHPLSGPLAGSR
ncbi:hypothetical protein MRX96_042609 [Rhipicephalus microplus]